MKDPYRYFRIEARELLEGLNKGVLEFEKGPVPSEQIGQLLRQAHTLKGAARVVRQTTIADLAHQVEGILSPLRDTDASLEREAIQELLKLLDKISDGLAVLDKPPQSGSQSENRESSPFGRFDTVRLEVAELDLVLEDLTEATTRLVAFKQESKRLEKIRHLAQLLGGARNHSVSNSKETGGLSPSALRSLPEELRDHLDVLQTRLNTAIDRIEKELVQAHEKASRFRLLPAGSLFSFLERAAREAAETLGKQIHFQATGGNCRLDAPVLVALQDALLHVVRNAVAHGVEETGKRVSTGKSPKGQILLQVERLGSIVVFRCRDDGCGIDVEAVRQAALQAGRFSSTASGTFSLNEAIAILLKGGVSTTRAATEVSGRGVGLDVVRETVERLQGKVHISSERGRGTVVEIRVPFTLSTFTALAVKVSETHALIPFDHIRKLMRVLDGDIVRSPEGESILFDQKTIPFIHLGEALRCQAAPFRPQRAWSVVVIQTEIGLAAIGTERLMGIREVVVRPLPTLAPCDATVAGACLDAEGNPCLVLDPTGLVKIAREPKHASTTPSPSSQLPLLIIDDSLTTRMLEQSILESEGYEVEMAASGEEALVKARERRYGLFLVDVEMPGMNGFEFLEKTRTDPILRQIPAILITSRASLEDRRRGQAAGARDYIVKDEFDQNRLLATIRDLIR